jgi:hypothetical protein
MIDSDYQQERRTTMRNDNKKLIAEIVKGKLDLAVNLESEFFDYAMGEVEHDLDVILRQRPTKSFSQ